MYEKIIVTIATIDIATLIKYSQTLLQVDRPEQVQLDTSRLVKIWNVLPQN